MTEFVLTRDTLSNLVPVGLDYGLELTVNYYSVMKKNLLPDVYSELIICVFFGICFTQRLLQLELQVVLHNYIQIWCGIYVILWHTDLSFT